MKQRQFILDLLSATPSPREAKSFLKKFHVNSDSFSSRLGLVRLKANIHQDSLIHFSTTLLQLQTLGLLPFIVLDSRPFEKLDFPSARKFLGMETNRICAAIESNGGRAMDLYNGALHSSFKLSNYVELASQLNQIPVIAPLFINPHSQYQILHSRDALIHIVREILKMEKSIARFMIVNEVGGLSTQNQSIGFVNIRDEYAQVYSNLCIRESEDPHEEIETVRKVLDILPTSASAIITSALSSSSLLANLITDKPPSAPIQLPLTHSLIPPTVLRQGVSVQELNSLQGIDEMKLWKLLEASFSKKLLVKEFKERLSYKFDKIFIAGDYEGAIITTKEGNLPYLDKLAVAPTAQGMGIVDILWKRLKKVYPDLFWRSRADYPVNKWYY